MCADAALLAAAANISNCRDFIGAPGLLKTSGKQAAR
jgi:hypothetical protein